MTKERKVRGAIKFPEDTSEYAITIKRMLNTDSEGVDPYYADDNYILSADSDVILDRDHMKIYKLSDFQLDATEKEIATQLIRDGYYGTFDELIVTVKKLANE